MCYSVARWGQDATRVAGRVARVVVVCAGWVVGLRGCVGGAWNEIDHGRDQIPNLFFLCARGRCVRAWLRAV